MSVSIAKGKCHKKEEEEDGSMCYCVRLHYTLSRRRIWVGASLTFQRRHRECENAAAAVPYSPRHMFSLPSDLRLFSFLSATTQHSRTHHCPHGSGPQQSRAAIWTTSPLNFLLKGTPNFAAVYISYYSAFNKCHTQTKLGLPQWEHFIISFQ